MVVRDFIQSDFNEVVDMYYKFMHEVYPNRHFKEKKHFEKSINLWIDLNYDIMITEKDGQITGFSVCMFDNLGGITDNFYTMEVIYVKPEYRKGLSTYTLVNFAVNYAESLGMIFEGLASEVTDSSLITSKHGTKLYTKYEKLPKGE